MPALRWNSASAVAASTSGPSRAPAATRSSGPTPSPSRDPLALGAHERGLQARREAAGARGPRDRDRPARRAVEQRDEQVDRRGVGPLDVVEAQHERPVARELLEQRADGAVRAMALHARGERGRRGGLGGGGEDRGEVGAGAVDPRGRGGAQRAERHIEGVDPQTVGQGVLPLGGAAVQDGRAALAGEDGELREQAGLADAGLAAERDDARRPGGGRVDRAREDGELGVAADDPTGHPSVRRASG